MSQENVEIARRAFDAWDRDDLDAFLAELDPEVVEIDLRDLGDSVLRLGRLRIIGRTSGVSSRASSPSIS